jgi:2'-5' RNA ligase
MLSAVVVAIPEAVPVVDAWRERTSDDYTSMGIPPHVTLLYPFVAAQEIDDGVLAELSALFAAAPPFTVTFRQLRRWPELAYLAPEPPEPFSRLTESMIERWPGYPPYEGIHATVVPHLTVAYGDDALLSKVEADVTPKLPIESVVREVVLLEELEPEPNERWGERARFPLSGASA